MRVPVFAAADELRFFDRGHQLAIPQDGGGGIALNPSDTENDHLPLFPRFSILAQVSRSAAVRLKTSLPRVESRSTQK